MVPTYLHFGAKNPTNSAQTSIPRHIKKMIEFGIDFFGHLGSIWGAKLGPDWHHFCLKWGGAVGCYPLLCFVASFILRFRGFDPVFAPTWLDFGASGPHLGGLLALFFLFWVPSWRHFRAIGHKKSWMKSKFGNNAKRVRE